MELRVRMEQAVAAFTNSDVVEITRAASRRTVGEVARELGMSSRDRKALGRAVRTAARREPEAAIMLLRLTTSAVDPQHLFPSKRVDEASIDQHGMELGWDQDLVAKVRELLHVFSDAFEEMRSGVESPGSEDLYRSQSPFDLGLLGEVRIDTEVMGTGEQAEVSGLRLPRPALSENDVAEEGLQARTTRTGAGRGRRKHTAKQRWELAERMAWAAELDPVAGVMLAVGMDPPGSGLFLEAMQQCEELLDHDQWLRQLAIIAVSLGITTLPETAGDLDHEALERMTGAVVATWVLGDDMALDVFCRAYQRSAVEVLRRCGPWVEPLVGRLGSQDPEGVARILRSWDESRVTPGVLDELVLVAISMMGEPDVKASVARTWLDAMLTLCDAIRQSHLYALSQKEVDEDEESEEPDLAVAVEFCAAAAWGIKVRNGTNVQGDSIELAEATERLDVQLQRWLRTDDQLEVLRLVVASEDSLVERIAAVRILAETGLVMGWGWNGLDGLLFENCADEWLEKVRARRESLEALATGSGPETSGLRWLLAVEAFQRGDVERAYGLFDSIASQVAEGPALVARGTIDVRSLDPERVDSGIDDLIAGAEQGNFPEPKTCEELLELVELAHPERVLELIQAFGDQAPTAGDVLERRARSGDQAAVKVARDMAQEALGAQEGMRLLLVGLDAAIGCSDRDGIVDTCSDIEILLADALDMDLDLAWAERLGSDSVLRDVVGPWNADAERVELLRRNGELSASRELVRRLFFRALSSRDPAWSPASLLALFEELSPAAEAASELRDQLDGEAVVDSAALDVPVHIAFVGGREEQVRNQAEIEASLSERYGDKVTVDWHVTGWSSNWGRQAEAVESTYDRVDAMVIMTFVRTNLGARLRRSSGEAGLVWVACTGHGRSSMEAALVNAVEVARKRLGGV